MESSEELYNFIKDSEFYYRCSHSSTYYESELNDRLCLLELLVCMIDLESLGYPKDVYKKDILHYEWMKKFRVAIGSHIHDDKEIDVKPYLERVAYYHNIKILENQPPEYYINILKVFKYVYDLIQNNKPLASLIINLWWVQRILAGRTEANEFSDEINVLINDEKSDWNHIMELMLKPHINALRFLLSEELDDKLDEKFINENLINDFKKSYACYYGADDAAYGNYFTLIIPIYNIIRDAIFDPESIENSEQLQQLVSLLSNFRKYI